MITWEQFLPDLFSYFLYHTIKTSDNKLYGRGLLTKWLEYHRTKKFMLSEPGLSFFRLLARNKCSYCDNPPTKGRGDHSATNKEDSLSSHVPCCRSCNSSKGNRDLIYWFCFKKQHNILELNKDVLSIYVRAKYRLLNKTNELDSIPPSENLDVLSQLQNGLVM